MPIKFDIVQRGSDYFCTADGGAEFFVGRRVPYKTRIGLYNIFGHSPVQALDFDPAHYADDFGFWVEFIAPTAACEGRNFLTLNTYDRAAFTIGFTQFAAHVADGDFVTFFRGLLGRADAHDYFPDLAVKNGRITRIAGPGSPQVLETKDSTQPLMDYLNPHSDKVDDAELLAAARLIHWTAHQRDVRLAQIREMIAAYRGFLKSADRKNLIDGRPAAQCCVIADVLHQGRGGKQAWASITAAMASADPLDALLRIGAADWQPRIDTLKAAIKANPHFATKKWRTAQGDFV